MQKLILVSTLLLASAAAAKPLAVLKQAGGFCAGQCPVTTLTIDDSGNVNVEYQTFRPAPQVERSILAKLSPKVIKAIQNDLTTITAAELIDLNEGQPICADIPLVTYTAVKDGSRIEIGQDRDCHEYRLSTYAGTNLATTLKNLQNLYSYSKFQ